MKTTFFNQTKIFSPATLIVAHAALVASGAMASSFQNHFTRSSESSGNDIRGVNLGSWFIPEQWMVEFYDGVNATDLCSFGLIDRNLADKRMMSHLASWITEDDFAFLATQGVNSIRLPLGYWNILDDFYNMYVPIKTTTSLEFIDKAFIWAEKYNMTVLLDLHGAPGSQNGNDHSGCGNGVVGWDTDFNRAMTVDAISELAKRYSAKTNLLGFELLNEPAYSLEAEHQSLLEFYTKSYSVIRSHSADALVVFNVLYSDFYNIWDQELPQNNYPGITIDWHLYDCFGDRGSVSTADHISMAQSWGPLISAHILYHPIFVGEWSLATGDNPGGQDFASAQETSFESGIGFYFWSLKLTERKDSNEWSFKSAIANGYIL